MTNRFENKVVLVTGGGGALGRVTALAFAREGATVVVAGRTAESLAAVVKEIEAEGGSASQVVADVTRPDQAAGMVSTVVERHGGLHVAFNNAGIFGQFAPVAELEDEVWESVISVNLSGVFHSMKHEIAHMREHGGGVIVNNSSIIGAHVRRPGMSAYAASKAALTVLTQTAAREYISDGVRINAVSPGASDTPLSYRPGETREDRDTRARQAIPIGRVGHPVEVANSVLWLASDEASFLVGHDLIVDGGTTA